MIVFSKVSFARRLRYIRSEICGYTQAEVAKCAGLTVTLISHFESEKGTRKPSITNIVKLAQALHVSTDYLLGLKANPEILKG